MTGRPLRSLVSVALSVTLVALGLAGDVIRASELVHVGALLVAAAGLMGLALRVPTLVWREEDEPETTTLQDPGPPRA